METSYKVSITNHPATKRHPITKKPMIKDGQPVPMITNQKAIKLDNFIIGYVMLETGNVSFIQPREQLGEEIITEAEMLAEEAVKQYGTDQAAKAESQFVPQHPEATGDEGEEFEEGEE